MTSPAATESIEGLPYALSRAVGLTRCESTAFAFAFAMACACALSVSNESELASDDDRGSVGCMIVEDKDPFLLVLLESVGEIIALLTLLLLLPVLLLLAIEEAERRERPDFDGE